MSSKFFYPAIFEPEEIGFSVYIPDIPGCMTQGDSMEEALDMVQDAIGLMLEGLDEADYPAASSPTEISCTSQQFVMMVPFDKLAYDKKYNSKSVKKTLSIPAWLNAMALKKNLNFSNILQNALMRELNV